VVLLWSVYTADTDNVGGVNTIYGDMTRQFCLVSTQFLISKFSAVLNIFETGQLQIKNTVETRQNSFVLSVSAV